MAANLVPNAVLSTRKRSSECTLCGDDLDGRAPKADKAEPGIFCDDGECFSRIEAVGGTPGAVDRFLLGRLLGEGSFARVRLVRGERSGSTAVVKTVSIVNPSKPRAALFSLREALALVHLPRHPNIPSLLDFVASSMATQTVLEQATGEELFSYVNAVPMGRLGEAETRKIVVGILSALRHAHANGVVHRDVKLDNVFWDPATEKVSLLDWGLATFWDERTMLDEAVGCINYASPQLLRLTNAGVPYRAARGWSDLWALGVLAHGLLTGYFPFRSEDPVELEREIRQTWQNASELEGVPRKEVSDACRDWLRTALDPRREGRLTAADLLAHPWLAGEQVHPVSVTSSPLPLLPNCTRDHRRVARLAAGYLQARLPVHRALARRALFGEDDPAPEVLPSPPSFASDATAMDVDAPEPQAKADSFRAPVTASASFSSVSSKGSVASNKSAVKRWLSKLSGRN
ncbi:kinase-like domain-containing protein [Hyaloraphidium curvatum]|nr:kinase-like domain-containing protein [Hyaloraphidium curvatum]